jgi:hypothetical protein
MRLFRPAVCVAAIASVVALSAPSDAAPAFKPKTLVLTDTAGDGNGLNGQGFADAGSQATPAQAAGTDMVKVEYASTGYMLKKGRIFVPKCTGFTIKMTLSAAPMAQTIYRITGTGVNEDGLWWIQYSGGVATLRYGTADEASNLADHQINLTTPAKVDGSSVLFTILETDVKASGENLAKFKITAPGAHDRADLVALTVPEWDEVKDYDGTYKPC